MNDKLTAMADKIYSTLQRADNSTITASESIYQDCLPENLTLETVMNVRQHDGDFIAASTKAVGDYAVNQMANTKEITELTSKINIGGKDNVSTTVLRTKEFTNSFAKEGEPKTITKHGVVTTTVELQHTRNIGALKQARNDISELAAKMLAG